MFDGIDGGTQSAGAVLVVAMDLDVIDCVFADCRSDGGGGLYSANSELRISGSTFLRCTNGFQANGNAPPGAKVVVEDTVFRENTASGNIGGAAMSIGVYGGGVEIVRCVFEGNEGVGRGAIGVGTDTALIRLEDCVFWNNRQTVAGGAGSAGRFQGGSITIRGNTFHGNSAVTGLPGSVVYMAGTQSEFSNNIVSGTTSPNVAVRLLSGTLSGGCNVFWENSGGNTNYTQPVTDREVDPQYCDPDLGDLRLSVFSPCLPPYSLGCGLIGALDQGCGVIRVEPQSWGSVKDAYR